MKWILAALCVAGALPAHAAEDYPAKPVTLVVGFPAGGGVDLIARRTAAELSTALGQTVVVKNQPGLGGVTATEAVASSESDGYTLFIVNPATLAINPALYDMAIDPTTGLELIARIAQTRLVGIVPTDSPAGNISQFLELAKRYPASFNYGSGGTGNINHLGVELLKLKTGTRFVHTPGASSSDSIALLALGSVQFMIDGLHTTRALIEAGKLRPVVVFADARLPGLPDVPTASESGLPEGLSITSWYGLAAPAGTPKKIIDKLAAALASVVVSTQFKDWTGAQGIEPAFLGPTAFREFAESERQRWGEVVVASGAKKVLAQLAAVPTGMGPDRIPAIPSPTKKFEVRGDRAYLDDQQIDLWGIRSSNALMSTAVTERAVRNLDNMAAHGLNGILVYVQGSNTGWPLEWGARNGFNPGGELKPAIAERLEWLIREADQRGMVVGVGIFTPRVLPTDANGAVTEEVLKTALQNVGRFLNDRRLHNVFVDLMHEFSHKRVSVDLLKEPDGRDKKAKLAAWFHEVAPDHFAGVCGTIGRSARPDFPGTNTIQLIQKTVHIPTKGYVVNCEMHKRDNYDREGVFNRRGYEQMFAWWEQYKLAENAGLFLHSGFTQGVSGSNGAAPYSEMGGHGRSPDDYGIRVYYDWVRDNVGRWVYPNHVPVETEIVQ